MARAVASSTMRLVPMIAAERADAVALEGAPERLGEIDLRGEAARVAVLDDRHRRRLEVARDAPRRVEVEQVVEAQVLAGDLVRGADGAARMRGIGVERAQLVRVLAVAQIGLLLDRHREAAREHRAGADVQVGRDLGVVGGGDGERLRGELLARLGAHVAERLDVAQHRPVLRRARVGGHAGEFLAAARRSAAPPMSICSSAPSASWRGRGPVCANG